MQISMKRVIFGNQPTKICAVYQARLEYWSLSLVTLLVTDKSSYSPCYDMAWSKPRGQDRLWGSSEGFIVDRAAENYWGPTQISLQKQPSWAWRAASAGSGAYSVTDCSSTSSRWQDKEILFILTNFFCMDREGAWSFLLLRQHRMPLRSFTHNVYCVREIHPGHRIRDKSE